MKQLLTFILLCLTGTLSADHVYRLKLTAAYQPQGKSPVLRFKLIYNHSNPALPGDSFAVGSNLDTVFRFRRPDSMAVDWISLVLYDSVGKVIFVHPFGFALRTPSCTGWSWNSLLKGKTCDSFPSRGLGAVCLGLELNWVRDPGASQIINTGGWWRESFSIFCNPNVPQFDPPLQFTAPCELVYANHHEKLRWYESPFPNGPWHFLDTGYSVFPGRLSWIPGTKMFNQQRYYRVVADTHQILGQPGTSTAVIGPVKFYIGADYDSVHITGLNCRDTGRDLTIHLKTDSFSQHPWGVGVYLWDHTNPSAPVRWYFGVFQGKQAISLNGRTGLFDPVSPSTQGKVFSVKKGLYRLWLDFTVWNGYACEIQWDSIWVDGPDPFRWVPRLIRGESCPGKNDAEWTAEISGIRAGDSAWYQLGQSKARQSLERTTGLSGGRHPLRVWNRNGCEVKDSVFIPGGAPFSRHFGIDTMLCNGQSVFVNASHPGSISSTYRLGADTLTGRDTFTLIAPGDHIFTWHNDSGCIAADTVRIQRRELSVINDFLLPVRARLSDTVWAVDHSTPAPDSARWWFDRPVAFEQPYSVKSHESRYSDTGVYWLSRHSRFSGCGFILRKKIIIVADSSAGQNGQGLGYKGPLIQEFSVNPNPNDGQHFSIVVKLRDTADIELFKIDPVSGDIIGDIAFSKKKYYEFTAFRSYSSAIFYLKLVAGKETQTIKVVVIQ